MGQKTPKTPTCFHLCFLTEQNPVVIPKTSNYLLSGHLLIPHQISSSEGNVLGANTVLWWAFASPGMGPQCFGGTDFWWGPMSQGMPFFTGVKCAGKVVGEQPGDMHFLGHQAPCIAFREVCCGITS